MKNVIIVQASKYLDIRQDKLIKSFVNKGYHVNVIYVNENESGVTKLIYDEIKERISFYHVNSIIPANIPFNYLRTIKIRAIIKRIKPEILICRDIMISRFIDENHDYDSYIDICDNFPEVLEVLLNRKVSAIGSLVANYVEKKSLMKFKKSIFVSDGSAEYIIKKHNLNNLKYIILENVPLKKEVKGIKSEGKLDFVYIGTINRKIRDIDTVISAVEYCVLNNKPVT
ncbi:MAG: glycosyltransferase, partial [Clostridium sp.]